MFYIEPVFEISLIGVADPGVPNKERIVLRPTENINLAKFGLFIGTKNPEGHVTPINDYFFWFGELEVGPPSWIVLYTGTGQFTQSKLADSGHIAYSLHWGKRATIFNIGNIVPVLFRMGGVLIGSHILPTGSHR